MNSRQIIAGITWLTLVAADAAVAADIETKSQIRAVTVFPSGAMVSRTAAIDLPQGASTLVIRNLPGTLDPASLRVEGQGSASLQIGATDIRSTPADPTRAATEAETELKALRLELGQTASLIDSLNGRKTMIQNYAAAGPAQDNKAALEVSQWPAAWNAVGEALTKVNDDLRKVEIQRTDLEARIKALEQVGTGPRRRLLPEREIVIPVEAGAALKGELTITYQVGASGWRPAYDAQLITTETGKAAELVLVRRALVSQNTGEDWSNAEITLSTVRNMRGVAAPVVEPMRVRYLDNEPMAANTYAKTGPVPALAAAPLEGAAVKDQTQRVPAQTPEAVVEANGYQASYRLPGRLDVPTGSAQKSMIIQSRKIKPELLIRASPSIDTTAYLEAAFVNDEEAPLLAGEVSLMRDNMFIGKGRLAFIAPGDRVTLGFGADDRVKITHVPLRRNETEPSALRSSRSDTRDFKTTVKNLHDFAIRAIITDRMPYSEDATLKVEPLATNLPPTEKTVEDKRGVMAWAFDLKPQQQQDIRFGYRITFPGDREIIMGRPRPIPMPMPRPMPVPVE